MSSLQVPNPTAASLLGFLHAGPMTGWELNAAVESSIARFWNVTRSQVYRELRTLAAEGLVEPEDVGPRERRPFRLTPGGRRAFADWIVRHPGSPIIRMPLLLTVFFGRHLPPGRLAEIVERELEAGVEALREFEALRAVLDGDPFVAKVVDFGVEYQRTLISWLRSLADEPPLEPNRDSAYPADSI